MSRAVLRTAALLAAFPMAVSAQQVRIVQGEPLALTMPGNVDRPMLGITTATESARGDTLGLRIEEVREGSPAAQAGLKVGDRLQGINGVSLRADRADAGEADYEGVLTRRLVREMEKVKEGDEVELRVHADGRTRTVKVKPTKMSELFSTTMPAVLERQGNRAGVGFFIGSTGSARDTLGVFVSSVTRDGPAEKAGIVEGDRIAAINGADIFEPGYRMMLQQGLEPERVFPRAEELQEPLWSGQLAHRFPGVTERCQMLDTLSYLPDDILVKVDRATMAASLEARAPLLDHRVFDMAWRLPDRMKLRQGVGKWALRELLYRRVPRQLVDRPKMGFGVPIDRWLRGPLRDWAEDLLDARRLSQGGILDAGAVGRLWQRHLAGQNWQYPLWCILMAEAWRRRWL
jgi:hypothetical protein